MQDWLAGKRVMDSLVNGVPADSVSVHDRGLAYGDGVFETIPLRKGEPLLLEAHMARLQAGCRKLGIPVPDAQECRSEIASLCAGRTGIAKLIITRGSSARGYAVQHDVRPNRLLLFTKWHGYPFGYCTEGIQLGICQTRVSTQELLAGIKHLNRLENVLAAQELTGGPMQEGIMLDHDDRIIECTRSNIFFIKNGQIHTPALERCGINGIMRNHILQLARDNGLHVSIRDIGLDEAARMDEAFVCNSLIGVWPVARLNDKISFRINMTLTIRGWTLEHTLEQGVA